MQNKIQPRLGEVFYCSKATKGKFECIQDLKGRYFVNFGGGHNQIFTIEDLILQKNNLSH